MKELFTSNNTIIYGALDVDDKHFNFASYDINTNEQIHFKCLANVSKLIKKLKQYFKDISNLKICYESTYLGFSLHRELNSNGLACDVIASGKIPKLAQDRVKTDRLDALKLAEYYAKGLLTSVYAPTIEDENVREILRSRKLLISQSKKTKSHIIHLCKRNGLDYRKEKKSLTVSYWSEPHKKWLQVKTNSLQKGSPLKFNLLSLNNLLTSQEIQIKQYNEVFLLV